MVEKVKKIGTYRGIPGVFATTSGYRMDSLQGDQGNSRRRWFIG